MHPITGRNTLEIAGESRILACDMNAAAVLYEKHGEHFALWLIERFIGAPITLPDGRKGRLMEKLPPAEAIGVLYALLASDREDSGRVDTEKDLRRAVPFGRLMDVQAAMTRSVIASFGIPGEDLEVVAGAVDGPPGSGRARTAGTGIAP